MFVSLLRIFIPLTPALMEWMCKNKEVKKVSVERFLSCFVTL